MRVQVIGFRVQGLGFKVQGSGFGVYQRTTATQGCEFGVSRSVFSVSCQGFRVSGLPAYDCHLACAECGVDMTCHGCSNVRG